MPQVAVIENNSNLQQRTDIITRNDPNFHSDFKKKVAKIFLEIQQAWTHRDCYRLRAFESQRIFQTHLYWIEQYRKQNLINVLKAISINNIEIAKITFDHYFISVTVRIFAMMIDTVESEQGELLAGHRDKARHFSEYWTFIRSQKFIPTMKADNNCPNCGSSLKINLSGKCEYCQCKVTSGDFDWILSRIEQDEAYAD